MKRNMKLAFAMILMIFMITSCSAPGYRKQSNNTPSESENGLRAQSIGFTDSSAANDPAQTFSIWSTEKTNYHQRGGAPSTASVTFDGKTYSGTYQKSCVKSYRTYESDYYEFDGGRFSVKSTDGSFESIEFFAIDTGSKTLSDMREAARGLVAEYIDPDSCDVSEDVDEYFLCYTFRPKHLKGNSNAAAQVVFCKNGDLEYFIAAMIPEMENALSALPENERENCIDRLRSNDAVQCVRSYAEKSFSCDTYEVRENGNLIVLPNGDLGILYSVYTTQISENPEDADDPYILTDAHLVLVTDTNG